MAERAFTAVLQVLREHASVPFCNGCLARRLRFQTSRVAVAAAHLEGSAGFRRCYDRCSVCGNDRLVITAEPANWTGASAA